MFPINKKISLSDIPEANRFGAIRRYDIHTGCDTNNRYIVYEKILYCISNN